jgi:hypothetical protein
MLQRQTFASIAEQDSQVFLTSTEEIASRQGKQPYYQDEEKSLSPKNLPRSDSFNPARVNCHPIQEELDKTVRKLQAATIEYLKYIKLEAKKILMNWPLDVLKKIDKKVEPVVALSFTLATVPILIDCSSLIDDSNGFQSTWLNNPCQEMVLKKLHNATCIYLCLTSESNKSADKIWAVKNFLASANIIQQMRMPRTPRVLPGNTRGARYIQIINTGVIESWVAMENLYFPTNMQTMQHNTVLRLEWICLDYVNHLLDKTLALLTSISLITLTKLSEASAEVVAQNRRLISVFRDDAKGTNKEFRIDCETLFNSMDYFPPAQHYHLKKTLTAFKFLQLVEETTLQSDDCRLKSFFEMTKQTFTQEYLLCHKNKLRGIFWKAEQSSSGMFLTNLNQVQKYYSDHANSLVEIVSPQSPNSDFAPRIRSLT